MPDSAVFFAASPRFGRGSNPHGTFPGRGYGRSLEVFLNRVKGAPACRRISFLRLPATG